MIRSDMKSRAVLLGFEANIKAELGDYYGAIDLYSKAIDLCPNDYRFYLNRAFCYEKTELYHLCLVDSEEAIRLNRFIEKCYIRKARALFGLKEYFRAEQTYHLILQMNPNSTEAKQDLIELRFQALKDMGFDKQTAMKGSNTYQTIRSATDGVLSQSIKQCFKDFADKIMNDINDENFDNKYLNNNYNYFKAYNNESIIGSSDPKFITNHKTVDRNENLVINDIKTNDMEGNNDNIVVGTQFADKARSWAEVVETANSKPTNESVAKLETNPSIKRLDKPTNIWGYNGIRVEKVNANNKRAITEVFTVFGKVLGVETVPNRKHSVWVYYDNPVSPIEAIGSLQSSIQPRINYYNSKDTEPLKLYFAATNEQKELKFCRPKHPNDNKGECYYWRTTTCLKGNCRLLHLDVNQHIDAQVWMKSTDDFEI